MATHILARSLLSTTTKQNLSSLVFLRFYSPRRAIPRAKPITAILTNPDPGPKWHETIGPDGNFPGCDFKHWEVIMEKPGNKATRDEIIDSYIKTLATVVGSEEEARRKIYSISTKYRYAFGAQVPEELVPNISDLPRVRYVLPDSYLFPEEKRYGVEPFIDGQALPYDPKRYNIFRDDNKKIEWHVRTAEDCEKSQAYQNMQNPGPNMGGEPSSNMGAMQLIGNGKEQDEA